MTPLNITTLKAIITSLGYKDVKTLNPKSLAVAVARTKVDKVVPELANALKNYKPKIVSDRELRVGDKTVFAKNINMQKTAKAFTYGRGNEHNLMQAITEYIIDYGKPLTVEFQEADGPHKFTAKNVMKVAHVGAKNIFARNKADIHLITDRMQAYPISIKDDNAGYWESADSYWGPKAQQFLVWALDNKKTMLEDNGAGGYSVRPAIAVAANELETRDVVFGSDIYGKGAVVVRKFTPNNFEWDYKRDVLKVTCTEIIQTEKDVRGSHEVYFEIRNEKGRNPKFLHKGLRTMAAMKSNLRGDTVFERGERQAMGL